MILAISLLLLAVVLVVMELAFPSLGMLGLAAATAYAFSLVRAFQESTETGWTFVGLGVILLPVAIAFGLKFVQVTPIGRKMFLNAPVRPTTPTLADPGAVAGARGQAVTDLRPAGSAEFDGRRVDVVASGGRFISRGTPVQITAVDGTRVVVELIREDGNPAPPLASGQARS